MFQSLEETRGSSEQLLRIVDFVHREAALQQMLCGLQKVQALLYVVYEGDVAVFVGAVDEREFDSGAGVAAVEDDEEG